MIQTVRPTELSDLGGVEVVVKGANFYNSPQMKCNFGTQQTQAKYVSATEVHCESPPFQIPAATNAVQAKFFISTSQEVTETLTIKYHVSLLVSDQKNHAVHLLNGQTGNREKTLISSGSGGLQLPEGVALGKDRNIYVVSGGTNQILRYTRTGEFMNTFANLPAKCWPKGLIVGPDGNWFLSCSHINLVLAFNAKSGQQLGVAARGGGLKTPMGLAFAPGNVLYVVSSGNNQILQYAQGGYFRGSVASGVQNAFDVAFHQGQVYSTGPKEVVTRHLDNTHVTHVHGGANMMAPKGFAFAGTQLFVANENSVFRFGSHGRARSVAKIGNMKASFMTASNSGPPAQVRRRPSRHTEL